MPTTGRTWVYVGPKRAKASVPEAVKVSVETKARTLVETVLKPRYIQPPPEDPQFNYIVDIGTKWYRTYFYFYAIFCCPGPTAISPSFESKFARLEYLAPDSFNLAFMRHTGQWVELSSAISLEQCLESIRDDPFFMLA